MDEIRVYVANLGKYNEGYLVGDWFTLPIAWDDLAERIGLNGEYEEYAIHDYEAPFEISEYTSIRELNRIYELVSDLPDYLQDALPDLLDYFRSIEELCERQDDIICYPDCEDMTDLARHYVEEVLSGAVPENLLIYFDYEKLGRDLSIESRYIESKSGVFEVLY